MSASFPLGAVGVSQKHCPRCGGIFFATDFHQFGRRTKSVCENCFVVMAKDYQRERPKRWANTVARLRSFSRLAKSLEIQN